MWNCNCHGLCSFSNPPFSGNRISILQAAQAENRKSSLKLFSLIPASNPSTNPVSSAKISLKSIRFGFFTTPQSKLSFAWPHDVPQNRTRVWQGHRFQSGIWEWCPGTQEDRENSEFNYAEWNGWRKFAITSVGNAKFQPHRSERRIIERSKGLMDWHPSVFSTRGEGNKCPKQLKKWKKSSLAMFAPSSVKMLASVYTSHTEELLKGIIRT